MGIFARIKNAITGGNKAAPRPAAAALRPVPAPTAAPAPAPSASAAPEPISEAAMQARIAALPGAEKFHWQTSIVDLMKLVGIDPSFENRKELADELGLEGYTGTADQNIALHHAVMNLLALEGGKVGGILED